MRTWRLAAVLVLAGLATAPAARADFRGFAAMERLLSERLLEPGRTLALASTLGLRHRYEYASFLPGSLLDLLGTYKGPGGTGRFRNGTPSPISALVWRDLLLGLGARVAAECERPALPLREELREALAPLCAWSGPGSVSRGDLQALWFEVVGFDAPFSAWESFAGFALSPAFAPVDRADAIRQLFLGMTLQPHLLLRN